MVIGASANRAKFGNKAVRAYLRKRHQVFPVNPRGGVIEGLETYPTVDKVPGPIDRALFYVPPETGLDLIDALATRGDVGEVWLNPGAESPELIRRARDLGFQLRTACAIVDIGERP